MSKNINTLIEKEFYKNYDNQWDFTHQNLDRGDLYLYFLKEKNLPKLKNRIEFPVHLSTVPTQYKLEYKKYLRKSLAEHWGMEESEEKGLESYYTDEKAIEEFKDSFDFTEDMIKTYRTFVKKDLENEIRKVSVFQNFIKKLLTPEYSFIDKTESKSNTLTYHIYPYYDIYAVFKQRGKKRVGFKFDSKGNIVFYGGVEKSENVVNIIKNDTILFYQFIEVFFSNKGFSIGEVVFTFNNSKKMVLEKNVTYETYTLYINLN